MFCKNCNKKITKTFKFNSQNTRGNNETSIDDQTSNLILSPVLFTAKIDDVL